MSNQSVKTLVEQTIKEFTDTSNKVSPRLIYLAKLAKHYKTFEEFENDYQGKNYHGIYWHLTTDPNFTINPFKGPRDLSSMGSGTASEPGLMVSTDLNNWHSTFNKKRQYVAQIDLSDLIPNVDYRDTSRGFGHEIYVFKPEGAKVVKVLPISKALKQNYDDYRRNLPQNQAQLKRIYDLAHQNDIKESHIDPSTSKNENRFEVSDLEHKYAVEYIKEKLLPALIKQFNDIREGKNRELAQYGKRYKGPFNEPITDVESTIRSLHRINKKYNSPIWMPDYGKFTYAATSSNGAIFEFIIEKSYPHVIRINSLDPWGLGYMGYELKPNGYPGGSLGYDALMKENKSLTKEKFDISKEEEQIIVGYISKKLLEDAMEDFNKQRDWYNALLKKSYRFLTYNDIEPTVKGLKKVGDEKLPTRKIKYSTKAPNGFYFEYIISKEKSNVISISELCGWGVGTSDYKLKFTGAEYVPLTENFKSSIPERITKEEEMRALQMIRDWTRKKFPLFGDKVNKELKRIFEPNVDILGGITYANDALSKYGYFSYRIIKLDGIVGIYDSAGRSYYDVGNTGLIANLTENAQPTDVLTKEDEMMALQFIRNIVRYTFGDMDFSELKKVPDTKKYPNTARYATPSKGGKNPFTLNFRIVKLDGKVFVQDDSSMSPQEKYWYPLDYPGTLKENTEKSNFHISKEEEQWALQQIRKFRIGNETVGKSLRKVRHVKNSSTVDGRDIIDYMTGDKNTTYPYLIRLIKVIDSEGQINLYASYPKLMVNNRSEEFDIPFAHYYKLTKYHELKENINEPSLHISKEEEQFVLQRQRLRKNNQGETIGKYLKKIEHTISNDPKQSDRIKFKNTDDGYTFTIVKNPENGKLGIRFGFIALTSATGVKLGDDYESSNIDPITESAPTGDWQGWGDITDLDKNRLKIVLGGYMNQIKNTYHPHIADPKIYLIKKSIDNFDVSDPRFAARPLARLSMEDRLSIGDFVDHADTAGNSSKTLDFLLNISRQYIEPPRPPTPDIVLDNIADVVWPSGKRKSDVTIHGLDDMKPIIGFGYAGYALTDNFIKEYSKPGAQLYIDLGADVRVTNMAEVIKAVKQSLERWNRSNLTESEKQYIELSKEDEQRAVQYLKRLVLHGQRIGKVLRKIGMDKSNDYHGSTVAIYAAKFGEYRYQFYIYRNPHQGGLVIRSFPDYKKYIVKENFDPKSYQPKKISISKEEEDKVIEFIKNIVVDGERVGKTLKKSSVVNTADDRTSDMIVYTAKVKGKDLIYRVIKGLRRGLVVRDASPDGNWDHWIVPT